MVHPNARASIAIYVQLFIHTLAHSHTNTHEHTHTHRDTIHAYRGESVSSCIQNVIHAAFYSHTRLLVHTHTSTHARTQRDTSTSPAKWGTLQTLLRSLLASLHHPACLIGEGPRYPGAADTLDRCGGYFGFSDTCGYTVYGIPSLRILAPFQYAQF